MHLIDSPGATGAGLFTEGNPLVTPEVPATICTAAWLNMVQLELFTVLFTAGITPDKSDNTQLSQALTSSITVAIDAATGRNRNVLAPYDVSTGDALLAQDVFGIARADASSGASVAIETQGFWALVKNSADVFAVGQRIYWDDTAKECRASSATGRRLVASAGLPAGAGSTLLYGYLGTTDVSEPIA